MLRAIATIAARYDTLRHGTDRCHP